MVLLQYLANQAAAQAAAQNIQSQFTPGYASGIYNAIGTIPNLNLPSNITDILDNATGGGVAKTPRLPLDPVKQQPKEDIAALAFETFDVFVHQAFVFVACGFIAAGGGLLLAAGIATSEVGVGIPVGIVGAAVGAVGLGGMVLMGYTMYKTWDAMNFTERWKQALNVGD